jgi:excisionase family DNA binding protein
MESNATLGEGLVPVRTVAQHLSVHRTTVYDLINKGQLPVVRVGKGFRIPITAVRELATARLRVR